MMREGEDGGGVKETFFGTRKVAAGENVGVRGLPVVGALGWAVEEFLRVGVWLATGR